LFVQISHSLTLQFVVDLEIPLLFFHLFPATLFATSLFFFYLFAHFRSTNLWRSLGRPLSAETFCPIGVLSFFCLHGPVNRIPDPIFVIYWQFSLFRDFWIKYCSASLSGLPYLFWSNDIIPIPKRRSSHLPVKRLFDSTQFPISAVPLVSSSWVQSLFGLFRMDCSAIRPPLPRVSISCVSRTCRFLFFFIFFLACFQHSCFFRPPVCRLSVLKSRLAQEQLS